MDAAQVLILGSVATDALERVGVGAAALLAALVVLARVSRVRAWAALAALVVTPVLLVAQIWDTEQFEPFRDNPAIAVGIAGAGVALVGVLAMLFHRRPAAFPLLAVATLPFRIPISTGGDTVNLLVPLYVVIAAGALAYLLPRLRAPADEHDSEPGVGRLEQLLMAVVALFALQAAYSSDFPSALEQVVFFYVPFALLFALLVRREWTTELLLACGAVLAGLALLFVGIGFVEYGTRELLLNPKVISSNEFESYFRVNSLFFDPNIYGRFLAIVMLGVVAVMLASRGRRVALAGGLLALLWGGLVLTFSQSSFAALLLGLALLAGLHWGLRRVIPVALGLVVVGAAFIAVSPGSVRLDLGSTRSVDKATSGRYDLVKGGVELWADRPLHGYGPGAFRREYRRHEKASSERASSASHTIPVTVAAEQGVGGLALYLALLFAAFARLFRGARSSVARSAIAAAFAALVLHTWLYAAFLEDPLAWALLGVGVALGRGTS